MRQRSIKNIDAKVEAYSHLLIPHGESMRGRWSEVFPAFSAGASLYAEIGTGKGSFIKASAQREPETLWLGVEGSRNALYRALQKFDKEEPSNLRFCEAYILDVGDFFAPGELSGIYLNFSDPWPKKRHEKRRLTSPAYLEGFASALSPGGFLRFKTDNDDFFEYSLEAVTKADHIFKIIAHTADLHNSEWAEDNIMTEYEQKFSSAGKNINFLYASRL